MWKLMLTLLALGHVTCVLGIWSGYNPWRWPVVVSKRSNGLDTRDAINRFDDFGDRSVISKKDLVKRLLLTGRLPWRDRRPWEVRPHYPWRF